MAPDLKTLVTQFRVINGAWSEDAENIRVSEPPAAFALGKKPDSFYLLLEPLGSFEDESSDCQQVADCIELTYQQSKGSVTAKLRAAAQAANQLLFEQNLQLPANQRGIMGMTGVVIHADEVYIAQVGPALAFLVHDGTLQRFPSDSPWLDQESADADDAKSATALGWRREVEPDLFYCQAQAQDLIVLSSTSLVRLASESQIVESLAYQDSETARGNLEQLAGKEDDLAAVILEVTSSAAPRREPVPVRDVRTGGLHGAGSTAQVKHTQTYQPPAGAKTAVGPRPSPAQPSVDMSSWARKAGELFKGILPEREAAPRGRGRKGAAPVVPPALWLALVVPVIILGLYLWNNWRIERGRQAELSGKLDQARKLMAAAQTAGPTEQRLTMQQVEGLFAEMLASDPDNKDVLALRSAIEQQADAMGKVTRIQLFTELATFPAGAQPGRLAVNKGEIFVLDAASGQVSRFPFDASRETLSSPAPEILTDPSIEGKKAVDLICAPMSSTPEDGKLIVLAPGMVWERSGQPPKIVAKPLPGSQSLTAIKTLETFYDAPNLFLYVLDPGANVIKKYMAAGNAYSDAPDDYALSDLKINGKDAVDLAIDGSIYILLKTKTVKLFQGKPSDLSLEGLDQPLSNPVAIAVSNREDMDKGAIYIADAGNQRIVQLDKTGKFVRQYRAATGKPGLDNLRDIYVDEGTRRLILLNGQSLYVMPLPE